MAKKEIRQATLDKMSNEQLRKVGYIRIPGFSKKDGTKVKSHIRKLDAPKGHMDANGTGAIALGQATSGNAGTEANIAVVPVVMGAIYTVAGVVYTVEVLKELYKSEVVREVIDEASEALGEASEAFSSAASAVGDWFGSVTFDVVKETYNDITNNEVVQQVTSAIGSGASAVLSSANAARKFIFGKDDETMVRRKDMIPLDKYTMVGVYHVPKDYYDEVLKKETIKTPNTEFYADATKAEIVSQAWDDEGMIGRMKLRREAEDMDLDFMTDKPMTKEQKVAFARVVVDAIRRMPQSKQVNGVLAYAIPSKQGGDIYLPYEASSSDIAHEAGHVLDAAFALAGETNRQVAKPVERLSSRGITKDEDGSVLPPEGIGFLDRVKWAMTPQVVLDARAEQGVDMLSSSDDVNIDSFRDKRDWNVIQKEKFEEDMGQSLVSSGRSDFDMHNERAQESNMTHAELEAGGKKYLTQGYDKPDEVHAVEETANAIWWKTKNPVEFKNTNPKMNEYLNEQIESVPGLKQILSDKDNNVKKLNKKELKKAGLMRIPGFKRKDGTKVKSYFRMMKEWF